MARQALAVQARPITLVALTEQIQVAVEPLGWTASVVREGDSLVVDLTGAVCPDPLLAMMLVEAELAGAETAGLEAVKLYGHCCRDVSSRTIVSGLKLYGDDSAEETEPSVSVSTGWMSVIDLDRYFSRRAALSPEAFGLGAAEASRMACEAELDRYAVAAVDSAPLIALEAESILEPEPQAPVLTSSLEQDDETELELADPWEIELPADHALAAPLPLDHFPRISEGEAEQDVQVPAGEVTPVHQTMGADVDGQPSQEQVVTQDLASLNSYDRYQTFITERSSWFAQSVKDKPRLHELAKQRQRYTIGTLSHYLVDTLGETERLMDLVPVRKRDRACGLIFTDQRVIALYQSGRRDSSGILRRNRQDLKVWMVPWSWVHKVEICQDALRFHYGRAQERFNVDLEVPYHLRNAIPRDIPVRMVREIGSSQKRALDTKTGLAMVAGVMFALGSGFSLVNNVMNRQQIEARSSNPLVASRNAIQANAPSQELNVPNQMTPADSVAAPLVMTTNHEQCVNSFNDAAQPHAYATLNQVTQTLQVNLQNQVLLQMSQQQFDNTAAAVAQEILSSCQAKTINQVVVTNGALRYQQQRPVSNITSVKTEDALKLF